MSNRKLTLDRLKQIVNEEKKKIGKGKVQSAESVETVEDAWAGGDNLVNQIDFIKTLGIKEARLRERAKRISRARKALKNQIVKEL